MRKIKVYWEESVLQTWSVEVEAESEEEAIQFIRDENGVSVDDDTITLEEENCQEALISVRTTED